MSIKLARMEENLKVFYLLILLFIILGSNLGCKRKLLNEREKFVSQFKNSRIHLNCNSDQLIFYIDTLDMVILNKDQYQINFLR